MSFAGCIVFISGATSYKIIFRGLVMAHRRCVSFRYNMIVWIYLHTTNMNIFKYSARDLTSVQMSGIIPFVKTYHPAVKNLKQLLMQEWSSIHNQPMLKNIYKTPPITSYRTGKSLKDILVRAKLWRHISQRRNRKDTWGSQSTSVMIFSQQSLNCVKFRTKSASFPFESSRPPCLIFLGIWKTADFVSGLEMSKISGDERVQLTSMMQSRFVKTPYTCIKRLYPLVFFKVCSVFCQLTVLFRIRAQWN